MSPIQDSTEIRRWYDEYIAANGRKLTSESPLILAVQNDELDLVLVEKRIEDLKPKITITGRFCNDCQALFDDWPDLSDSNTTDHPDGTKCFPGAGADWKHAVARSFHTIHLEAAARNGCVFCALLVQKLRDTEQLRTFHQIDARIESLGETAKAHLSLQNWGRNQDQLLWVNWPGKVSDHCNGGTGPTQKLVVGALNSEAATYQEGRDTLDIAKRWIQDCSDSHPECNEERMDMLPTRLLCVGEDQVRLVSTAGWQSGRRFTTLSHRWNADDFTVLLKDNISALSLAISPQQLPNTFADAIEITRKLGVDYIWIDSLCIIQDDENDWRRETALMEYVYGGSYLNIAASSATSVHGGCWVKGEGMHSAFRARVKAGDGELVREFRDEDCYDRAVWSSHLATRAWALQEKVLPPRTLHLGDRGAFWECRHTIASECLPDGFTDRLGSGLLRTMRQMEHLQGWWAEVVHLFTGADLTFARDKLPALSGVARRIHGQKGGQYLAGLWRDERLEAQLCWRVFDPKIRPTEWRAPSWSWASVDGRTSYMPTQDGICDNTYGHVVDSSVTPLAGDVFGQLSAGTLHLECAAILSGRVVGSNKVVVQGNEEEFQWPIFLDALDEDRSLQDGKVYLLPLVGGKQGLRSKEEGESEWYEPNLVQGMVLCRTGSTVGEFCRVGCFECEQPQRKDDLVNGDTYHEFMQELERSGQQIARAVCAKASGSGEAEPSKEVFTIVIV